MPAQPQSRWLVAITKHAQFLVTNLMRSIPKAIFFFFLVTLSFNCFSQDSTGINETKVTSLICKKSIAVSMEANGRKATVTKCSIVSFNSDGAFTDSTQGLGKINW